MILIIKVIVIIVITLVGVPDYYYFINLVSPINNVITAIVRENEDLSI